MSINTHAWIDARCLGSGYYDLLPAWMKLVEAGQGSRSSASMLAFTYATALAAAGPGQPALAIELRLSIEKLSPVFLQGREFSIGWIETGQRSLVEHGHILVNGSRIELTWPTSHALYAMETRGAA